MPNPWVAIVGRGADGRTDTLRTVVDSLGARGHRVAGFLQERFAPHGELAGYDLVDLETDVRHPLARRSSAPDVCDWGFSEETFALARAGLMASSGTVGVLELGPFEARGHGHWDTVLELLDGPPRVVLVTLRPDVAARVAVDLPDPSATLELPATRVQIDEFLATVCEAADACPGLVGLRS